MIISTIQIFYFVLFVVLVNLITGFKKSNALNCGLVGFSGKDPFNINLIRTLLWHNSQTRGKDATGIFSPSNGVKKDVKEAKDFFRESDFKNFKEGDNLLLAHVRKATVGAKDNPDSAHPWDFGDIIMMHNGTLVNYEELAGKYNIDKYTVDSQVLGMAIQDNFKTGEPFKVLSEYTGAAATVVYHKERDSMFVYRDEERTLFRGYLNDTEMYISSIADILDVIGCTNITAFDPYKVYEFKEGKLISNFTIKRKKANQNNVIRLVVDTIKEFIFYKDFSAVKRMFNDNIYSGISRSICTSDMIVDYVLRASAYSNPGVSGGAKITKDNFYKIHRIKDANTVWVTDDTKIQKEVSVQLFDTLNFIPTQGDYIKMVEIPVNNKENLKLNELYEVVAHSYGSSSVIIRDHNKGFNLSVTPYSCRLATVEEIKNQFKNVEVTSGEISTKIIGFNREEKTEDIIDITDAKVVDIKGDKPEEDESIDANELIVNQLALALVMLSEYLTETVVEASKNNYEDSLEKFKILATFAEKCSDFDNDYILNVNENSILNIQHAKQ